MPRPKFLFACPETCADLLHAARFRAPDAFAFLESAGKKHILLNDLEVDRGRAEAPVDCVDSYSELEKSLRKPEGKRPTQAKVLASWLASTPAVRAAPPPTSALTFGLWLLLSAAGLLGARLARGLHGARRPEDWASEEPSRQPQAALLAAGQGARRLLDALTSASARLGARLSAPFGP